MSAINRIIRIGTMTVKEKDECRHGPFTFKRSMCAICQSFDKVANDHLRKWARDAEIDSQFLDEKHGLNQEPDQRFDI